MMSSTRQRRSFMSDGNGPVFSLWCGKPNDALDFFLIYTKECVTPQSVQSIYTQTAADQTLIHNQILYKNTFRIATKFYSCMASLSRNAC